MTEEWRARVRNARKEMGLRQSDVARKLGVKQSSVSDLEAGNTLTSDLVLPLSRLLKVDPPRYEDVDEFTARWRRVEAVLREQSPELAEQVLAMVEAAAAAAAKKR